MEENKVKIVRYNSLSIRKKLGDTDDSATLSWSIRGMYPRCTIYTSNKQAFVNSKPNYDFIITAPFDIVTLEMVLSTLEEIVDADNGSKFTIDCLNNKIENGERKTELILQARMTVGKDDNGVIYMAVTEEGKKKIKFDLLPTSNYFKYYDKSNQQIKDEVILSKLYTKGYVKTLREYLYRDLSEANATVVVDRPNINNGSSKKDNVKVDTSKLQSLKKEENDIIDDLI